MPDLFSSEGGGETGLGERLDQLCWNILQRKVHGYSTGGILCEENVIHVF